MICFVLKAALIQNSNSNYRLDCGHCSGGDWGNASILFIDLGSRRLRNLVQALEPLILRIGGSQDNICKYQFNMSLEECQSPSPFRGSSVSLCLTHERWDKILDFYNETKTGMVLGTQYFEDKSGSWISSNVEALLRYTAGRGMKIRGLELGEEMTPSGEAFDALVDGYKKLKTMAKKIFPGDPPLILGPSCGMGDENEQNRFMNSFLKATLADGGILDNVNMHSYNNDGGWPKPGFLKQTKEQAIAMLNMTVKYDTGGRAHLWCGECGPHNGGGIVNVTDRITSSFWYIDALGALAKMGLQQHGRQSLSGSHYGLLQLGTFKPNPGTK
eukprot:UC4_evm1s1008